MERLKRGWQRTPSTIRKPLVGTIGVLVILAGIVMLAIPGPGWLTIFLGLAILATEFEVAKRLKNWAEHRFKQIAAAAHDRSKRLRKK